MTGTVTILWDQGGICRLAYRFVTLPRERATHAYRTVQIQSRSGYGLLSVH